jgi:hypothetical protein
MFEAGADPRHEQRLVSAPGFFFKKDQNNALVASQESAPMVWLELEHAGAAAGGFNWRDTFVDRPAAAANLAQFGL